MALLFRRNREDRRPDTEGAWSPGDSIPAPEVVQKESDSVWEMWTEESERHDQRFRDTVPAPAPVRLPPEESCWANTLPVDELTGAPAVSAQPAAQRPAPVSLEGALRLARRNSRICPRPERWDQFAAMLPPRKTLRGVQHPPAAITGAAWAGTPDRVKRICFREQLEWAERVGMLQKAMDFMQALREEEWLHAGEE